MNTKANAIWFSQHTPTDDQLKEIESLGYNLFIDDGKSLGEIKINDDDDDLKSCWDQLIQLIKKYNAIAIFGVASTPFQNKMLSTYEKYFPYQIPFYSAWNIQRALEGEKFSFKHKKWMITGYIKYE